MPGVSNVEDPSTSPAESPDRAVSDNEQKAYWAWRALRSLPLLGAAYYCLSHNSSSPLMPIISSTSNTQTSRLQMLAMIANLFPLQTIWTVESVRRGNASSPLSLVSSAVWGTLSQIKGIGCIGPIYYFLHYVLTPPERYRVPDDSMVDFQEAKAIMPALAVGYGISILAGYFMPDGVFEGRPWVVRILCDLLPIWSIVLQRILRRSIVTETSTEKAKQDPRDIKKMEKRHDLRFLRYAYIFSGTTSTALSLYLRYVTGSSWLPAELSSSGGWDWEQCASSLAQAAGLFWEVLHWQELKGMGKTTANWFHIGTAIAGTAVVAGPHTATMVGWACRDQVLGRRAGRGQ